jgi:hypothetical protein
MRQKRVFPSKILENSFSLKLNTDGTITAAIGNGIGGTVTVTAAGYVINAWHYVAFTFETSTRTLSLFLDGILLQKAIMASPNTDFSSSLPIDIGRRQETQAGYFDGAIEEILSLQDKLAQAKAEGMREMITNKELLEILAELEHQQWIFWSRLLEKSKRLSQPGISFCGHGCQESQACESRSAPVQILCDAQHLG